MAASRRLAAAVATLLSFSLPLWVAAGDWDGGAHCSLLTPENFDSHQAEKRQKNRLSLVMFHVSWCKVCQRAFPEFVAASQKAHELGLDVDFAHVDCTDDKTLCQRVVVKGYPTIKLFLTEEGAEPRTYKSPRNVDAFIRYCQRMKLPSVREFASASELEEALSGETNSAFIAASTTGQALPAGLEKASKEWMDRHIFASNPELAALLPKSVGTPPSGASLAVLSMRSHQQWPGRDNTTQPVPAVAYYTGSLADADAVSSWIERNRFPGVWALSETNFYDFTHSNRRVVILTDDPLAVAESTEVAFRKAASELNNDFIFGVVDAIGWSQELADFNIYSKDLPRLLVVEDNFDSWVEDVDFLRPATATDDLRALSSGQRDLLRQNRKFLSRIFFYLREAQRFFNVVQEYASRGPQQAGLVALALLLGLGATFCILWCLYKLFCVLLGDDYDNYKAPPRTKKMN